MEAIGSAMLRMLMKQFMRGLMRRARLVLRLGGGHLHCCDCGACIHTDDPEVVGAIECAAEFGLPLEAYCDEHSPDGKAGILWS